MAAGEIKPPWLLRPFLDEFLAHYGASFDIKKAVGAAAKKFKVDSNQLDHKALYDIQNDEYVCKELKKRAKIVKEHNFNHTKERVEMELTGRTYDFDPTDTFEIVDSEVNTYDRNGNIIESRIVQKAELKNPESFSYFTKKMIKSITNTSEGVKIIFKDDSHYLKMLGTAYGMFDKVDDENDNGEPVTIKINVADGRRDIVNINAGSD